MLLQANKAKKLLVLAYVTCVYRHIYSVKKLIRNLFNVILASLKLIMYNLINFLMFGMTKLFPDALVLVS